MIIIIAAFDSDLGLGRHGRIPWNLPADMKRFRTLTTGHPVVMGRKTFEAIGKPLPARTNIVVSRSKRAFPGCLRVDSIASALRSSANAEGGDRTFVIGGGEIFAQALTDADDMLLTIVSGHHGCDAFFPEKLGGAWTARVEDRFPACGKRPAFAFCALARCRNPSAARAHLITDAREAIAFAGR